MVYQIPFPLDLKKELSTLKKDKDLTFVNLGNSAAKSFLISKIIKNSQFDNIFWGSDDEKAHDLLPAAEFFFDGDILPLSENPTLEEYYKFAARVQSPDQTLFLFEDFSSALQQTFPSQSEIDQQKLVFKKGDTIQIFQVFSDLEKNGYVNAPDKIINKGEFIRKGDILLIFPFNTQCCYRIELNNDKIEKLEIYLQSDDDKKTISTTVQNVLEIFPGKFNRTSGSLLDCIKGCDKSLIISDDLDDEICPKGDFYKLKFTTFPKEDENFFHLNFFSVLPFYTIPDFITEIKERLRRGFSIVIATKKTDEILKIFQDNEIMHTKDLSVDIISTVKIIKLNKEEFVPHSFQNNDKSFLFLTDREIFQFTRSSRQKKAVSGINFDLMTSLKPGNFAIHQDHGVSRFEGIIRRDLGAEFGREYLKLCYAENDKLFVPVESAEKITKFIGNDEPRLTKLGAADWQQSQKKLKKEAERIAADLLKLYAQRELVKGAKFHTDDEMLRDFYASFSYELTPGQAQTWNDVRIDLERVKPMDRMVCGDVGFGKTEIGMRAAFKSFRSGFQTAILAPITILAEQHYQSFSKRINDKNYGIRVELLSRFQTNAEQNRILKDLELGLVDVVIGTHRLFSDDVKFKNLGLIIIDEEQRFGV